MPHKNESDPSPLEGVEERQTSAVDMGRRRFLIASGVAGAGLAGVSGIKKTAAAASRVFADNGGDYDAVIVGSGINALVAAAMLARAGWRICVLERNDRPGGCIRTEELTLPGFKHDVLSSWHPLFVTSPAYAALKDDLHARGLEYLNTPAPTASILPDRRSLILRTSREENVKAMDAIAQGDGQAYQRALAEMEKSARLTFGLLGKELYSYDFFKLMFSSYWDMGFHELSAYFGQALISGRTWLERDFQSELTRALLAPWPMHAGIGPDENLAGFIDQLIFFTLEFAGMPVVKGGSQGIVDAFVKLIEEKQGKILVNQDVQKVILEGKKAKGVQTADGGRYTAKRAVICSVTPQQLYGRLLDPKAVPADVKAQARGFRFGRGGMQIHLALSEAPQWPDPDLAKVAMVHLTTGLDGVSRAVNESTCGYLPLEPTIVVGQPTALDPSRAPEGRTILWLQLQELPSNGNLKGDAGGAIPVPADRKWNDETAQRYADRVIERIAAHVPNLKEAILARKILSPADLERHNVNLVGGDPYSGVCSVDQYFFWRPLRATRNHDTPVEQLYHIGASTHPGPGLGGVSGFLVAQTLLD